ncbi:MAG TPA: LysM domain-containing protein [Acidimicrobiia bacterium]|nr:LysM domain-containing protein [Acidimicrobiia bacterium]
MAAVMTVPGFGVATGPATRRCTPRAATRGRRCSPTTYRRRRMAALLVSVGLVVVAAQAGVALGGSSLAASERRPTSQPGIAPGAPEAVTAGLREVVVRPGDTLWAIAVRISPDEDPRPLVDELMAARDGAPLEPGEVIVVPV